MAPEMLEYVPGTDARPADVYSLAKCVWALVARRNYPLPGHQRADDRESLVALTGENRARDLDRLIEAATEHDPERRPAMAEMATGLNTWVDAQLRTPDSKEEDELTAAVARARERLSTKLSEAEAAATDLNSAQSAFGELIEGMQPVLSALRRLGASGDPIQNDQMLDATLGHPFLEELGRPLIVWRNQLFWSAQIGEDYDGVRLAVACASALYEGRVLTSSIGILVYEVPPTLGSDGYAWHDSFEARIDRLTVREETQHLAHRALQQMPAAIASFSEIAERL